jgi:hypothetical protein
MRRIPTKDSVGLLTSLARGEEGKGEGGGGLLIGAEGRRKREEISRINGVAGVTAAGGHA